MGTTPDDRHTPAHILLVDDDEQIRQLLRRMLEPDGYYITEAATAEEALWSVEEAPPSVAFCDMHMPGANGLWLADRIRASSPTTAIVLATGDSEIPPVESMRAAVVAYLVKPLSVGRVRAAAADGVQWSADARAKSARRGVRGLLGSAGFLDE